MIRERVALVSFEQAATFYRLWTCRDCGLDFSMKTMELPKVCPRCLKEAELEESLN